MDWRAIRQILLNADEFELEITGAMGKSKTITLTMSSSRDRNLTFRTLGSGSMKRVVKVDNEEWVLALAGDSPAAKKDMDAEVETLKQLSEAGVRVPEPFVTGLKGEILFNLKILNTDSGDTKSYPAFLQQYLPYQEMDKLKKKADFAQDFIVNESILPANLDTTVSDLKKILTRLKVREWGDFQVIYQKATGFVYVFDPLPENNSGTSFVPLVERWLSDIEAARNRRQFDHKKAKTAQGAWEV